MHASPASDETSHEDSPLEGCAPVRPPFDESQKLAYSDL